jgi:hypothetical protein
MEIQVGKIMICCNNSYIGCNVGTMTNRDFTYGLIVVTKPLEIVEIIRMKLNILRADNTNVTGNRPGHILIDLLSFAISIIFSARKPFPLAVKNGAGESLG